MGGRPSSASSAVSASAGEDEAADEKRGNFLCVCDKVSLFSDDHNGYLGAEGFADDRIVLYHNQGDQKPIKFSDCMFEILPQHNYSAQKALKKHKKKMAQKQAAAEEAAVDAAKG